MLEVGRGELGGRNGEYHRVSDSADQGQVKPSRFVPVRSAQAASQRRDPEPESAAEPTSPGNLTGQQSAGDDVTTGCVEFDVVDFSDRLAVHVDDLPIK